MKDVSQATEPSSTKNQGRGSCAPESGQAGLNQDIGSKLTAELEAVLLTIDRPISSARLCEVLGAVEPVMLTEAVKSLNHVYEQTGRSFRIEQVAGGWQIRTLGQFASVIAAANRSRTQTKLSPAAMETLAIIAYKQPIVRAEIESIRGVACGEVLRGLMDRGFVRIVGRAEEIGRPLLYGTSKAFLEIFGLGSLRDLPKVEQSD